MESLLRLICLSNVSLSLYEERALLFKHASDFKVFSPPPRLLAPSLILLWSDSLVPPPLQPYLVLKHQTSSCDSLGCGQRLEDETIDILPQWFKLLLCSQTHKNSPRSQLLPQASHCSVRDGAASCGAEAVEPPCASVARTICIPETLAVLFFMPSERCLHWEQCRLRSDAGEHAAAAAAGRATLVCLYVFFLTVKLQEKTETCCNSVKHLLDSI
ncbi:hypothetical protein INR49_009743 [Caranx melampygus]|nr:hypothetical protein INR49_009743 [Caranx melampygus]